MTTIIAGTAATISVTVMQDGSPVPVAGSMAARVFTMDGKTELVPSTPVDQATPGASWAEGVVVVALDSSQTTTLPPGDAMLVLQGGFGIKRFKLVVETLFEPTRTSLFIKDIVVNEIRQDRLVAAAAGVLNALALLGNCLIWSKIL